MKTAISVPDDLFHRAEREAARRGTTRSAIYTEALRRLFESANDVDPVTVKLDEVYGAADASVAGHGREAALGWIEDGTWTW